MYKREREYKKININNELTKQTNWDKIRNWKWRCRSS